jgi:hypothetical protein
MNVTSENLVLVEQNHQTHLPIFINDDGVEVVAPDGQRFIPLSQMNLSNSRRETVERK